MTGGLPRTRDTGRPARLAALACAVSTLLAALLLCVSPAWAHGTPAGPSGAAAGASGNVQSGHVGLRALQSVERPVQGPALDHMATPVHMCSALDADRGPGGRSGCSGASEQGADATLPGPPPQPGLAALPYLPLLPAAPASGARGPLPGSDLAPDLHVLQVQRT